MDRLIRAFKLSLWIIRLSDRWTRVINYLILLWSTLPAANRGRGNPVFKGETDCTYNFVWETVFACVKEKEDVLCRTRDGNKHYDLSPLTRYPGEFNSSINQSVGQGESKSLCSCSLTVYSVLFYAILFLNRA